MSYVGGLSSIGTIKVNSARYQKVIVNGPTRYDNIQGARYVEAYV